jgi:hypothetical protein
VNSAVFMEYRLEQDPNLLRPTYDGIFLESISFNGMRLQLIIGA